MKKSEPILPDELTSEELSEFNEIAEGLAKKYNVPKVHVYVGINSETKERIVGYLKDPSYVQKLYAMDKITTSGMWSAASEMREMLLLKGESDPRTYGDSYDCDEYKLGIDGLCLTMGRAIQNSFKKK